MKPYRHHSKSFVTLERNHLSQDLDEMMDLSKQQPCQSIIMALNTSVSPYTFFSMKLSILASPWTRVFSRDKVSFFCRSL